MTWSTVLSRLGLVTATAVLGLGAVVGSAVAEPTGTTAPPTTTSPATPPPTTASSEPPPSSGPSSTTAPDLTVPESTPPGGLESSQSAAPPADPPVAPRGARQGEVEVSAVFDKASYRTGETISIRFSVTNLLTVPMRKVHVYHFFSEPDSITIDFESWGALGDGVDIAPGDTVTVTVIGRVADANLTTAALAGFVYDVSGHGIEEFRFTTPVTPSFGSVTGTLYADRNGNARFDGGEGLAGATVTATNYYDYEDTYTATTNASGTFTFAQLPSVRMQFTAVAPDDWLVGYRFVTLEPGQNDLLLRAVRPLDDLTATVAFTKDSYQIGQTAHVTVTLRNSGDQPKVGIVANCARGGSGNSLSGATPGWGDLRHAAGGVTIGANQTRTFTVSEVVPREARDFGRVIVGCDFSYLNVDDERNPTASDFAKVPGGFGDINGTIWHYQDDDDLVGVGVADVRVVLTVDERCPLVAETRTDAEGRFLFRRVPAGEYELYFLPPDGWRMDSERNPERASVHATGPTSLLLAAVPGAAPLPTLPEQPADCDQPAPAPPVAQGSAGPKTGLADTGANVLGLAAVGLGTLGTGLAAIVLTRRRRSNANG